MSRAGQIFFLVLGGLITDLFIFGFGVLSANKMLSPDVKMVLGWIAAIPYAALLYGVMLGVCCRLAFGEESKLSGNEVIGAALVFPLAYFMLSFFLFYTIPAYAGLGIPYYFVFHLCYGILLAVIARGILYLRLGFFTIIITGLVAGAIPVATSFIKAPVVPSHFFYTIVTLVIAIRATMISLED